MMIDVFLRRADDPDVVAVLDGDGPTFRQELFPGFKSGREEKPPDLVALLARLPEAFGAAGVRTVEPPQGYEADDVIASMATEAGGRVAILSSDTDFYGVLSSTVTLCRTIRGNREQIDASGRRGAPRRQPWAVARLPGPCGQAEQRAPGGSGDLEGVLDRPVRMKAQYRRKLKGQADAARLRKRLSTLVTGLELEP